MNVLFSEEGRVAVITLNNPSKLNALTGKYPYFKDYIVEKPAEIQSSIWVALARVLDSTSRGFDSESPMPGELSALTRSGKTRGVRSFYVTLT